MVPSTIRTALCVVTLYLTLATGIQQTDSFPENDTILSFNITKVGNTTHQNTTQSNETNDVSKYVSNKSYNFIETELVNINKTIDTLYQLVDTFYTISWYYVNHRNKTAGLAALNEGRCVEQKLQLVNNTINTLLEFINKHNTTQEDEQIKGYISELEYIKNILSDYAIVPDFVHIFRHLYNLTERYYKIHELNNRTKDIFDGCYPCDGLSDLKTVLEYKKACKNMIESFLKEAEHLKKFKEENNLNEFYSTNFIDDLLNLDNWKNNLLNRTKEIINIEDRIAKANIQILMGTSQGIIFVIGFVENVFLLLIFVTYKKMRTAPNLMLMNLAFVDCLNLLVNIPAFFAYYVSNSWLLNEYTCIVFRFFHHTCISVSVYSVVVISVQRFLGIAKLSQQRTHERQINKFKHFCVILTPWMIGSLIAVPHIVYAGIYDGECYAASEKIHKSYPKFVTVIDIFAVCVIPLTVIAVFSILTIRKINRSIRDIPGEITVNSGAVQTRMLSSRVLASLTIVFALSYIPYYLFLLIQAWVGIQMNETACYLTFFIVFSLLFGNACFNPVALYISSQNFRFYFKSYLTFRKENNVNESVNRRQGISLSSFTKSISSKSRNSRIRAA